MHKDRLTRSTLDSAKFVRGMWFMVPTLPPFMRLNRSLIGPLVVALAPLLSMGQPTDLIISEYVEGLSNEKYLELYNGTSAPINLADYQLRLYANGGGVLPGLTGWTTNVALTGTLASGAVIVYRNSAATLYPTGIVNNACNWNGDDAVVLWRISTAAPVDILGMVTCDPGTQWTATGLSTVDRTLRRRSSICSGVSANPPGPCGAGAFTTLLGEWEGFAVNDVSGLGSHTMVCSPTVTMATPSNSALESAGSATITLNITPAATVAGTVTIGVTNGAGATYTTDYTTTPATTAGSITRPIAAGATTVTFSVNLVDDILTEGDETVTFTLTGASAGFALGSALSHVFTISDNDFTPTINFSTLSVAVLENAGTQTFNLSINPAAPAAGSITITVSNGPGACYGFNPCDYITAPGGASGSITVNFTAGATAASFNATVINDLNAEATELVTFTITGVPAAYAIGSNNVGTLTIGDNDTPPATLEPGDLVVVGVNSNAAACGGGVGEDQVSFFCFKPITPGTAIIITDNGFSRCTAGFWGNTEGTVTITRSGIAIPAGQVVTLRISNTSGSGNITGISPDAGWSCASAAGLVNAVNMNSGGDQLFFAQGGAWTTNTPGAHNAGYSGSLLYGFSTNPSFPWSASCTGSTADNQRSNLPPGLPCFSMAPTLATDFNKYVGPMTAASQRDWIIRVDDPANWASYASCADYGTGGFNWLTAPILPITVAPFVEGRWRGSTSTDWFDCKNWDDARVPTIATNVTVDAAFAARNCEVGLVAGSAAECASLLHTSGGLPRQLIVRNGSSLTIDGPLNISRTAAAGGLTTSVLDVSELNCTSINVTGVTPGAVNEAILRCEAGGVIRIEDDLTIGTGGLLDLQGAAGNSGTLLLGGNWTNLESELHFQDLNSRVILNGNVDQSISIANGAEVFGSLQLAKSAGDVLLSSPVEVRAELDLSGGRIFSTATELLTMRAGSTAVNASDLSFVHGPVQKVGNTDFTFPVGKDGNLRPCGLSALSGTTTGAFTAEYFPITAYSWGTAMEPTLDHISDCEYWIIDRSAGSSNAVVELTWDTPESCGVTAPPDLRVARWDAVLGIWQDRGNGGATPLAPSGTVISDGVQTLFSPWTLASVSNENPLPISLIGFTAKPEGTSVRLDWTTANERNNELFTVERSADGNLFSPVLEVPGAGFSDLPLSYSDLDRAPLQGVSYYRLRQTDHDGASSVSAVVSVVMGRNTARPLSVFVGEGRLNALHGFRAGSHYELLDMTGRMIIRGTVQGDDLLSITMPLLRSGAYLLRLADGERTESARFVF